MLQTATILIVIADNLSFKMKYLKKKALITLENKFPLILNHAVSYI